MSRTIFIFCSWVQQENNFCFVLFCGEYNEFSVELRYLKGI